MGRGRAKAKQAKVARDLKYYSPSTDFSALERELHGATQTREPEFVDDTDDDDDDDYGRWVTGRR
ncbi:MAG TPA: DUF3073 domain-containing protein [Tetrasphaera sp.]|uniref:DUF3073 domain-containing protein n=1 Tax=Nostocoides vanveenii TaxID=330835 RepID=A0ABN2KVD4_9MICO|nr:DUF3073 domain-containing protein [Tetrasphaera sp.]HNQ08009.1 DUF3073 domain-containing protein [Tetrasphaera sp.]